MSWGVGGSVVSSGPGRKAAPLAAPTQVAEARAASQSRALRRADRDMGGTGWRRLSNRRERHRFRAIGRPADHRAPRVFDVGKDWLGN